MCMIVLVVLIVAAVLIFPALARIVGAAVLILLAVAALAYAGDRRPLPQQQVGAGCPPGYSTSPTSGTCVPSGGTRCRAFPSPTGSCPTGWSYSPTSKMCGETVCR
jgi:hypothetical protein